MSNPILLRPFLSCDWEGFAGAECFGNGDEPLIGETMVDGIEMLVVVDGYSIQVFDDGFDMVINDAHGYPNAAAAIEAAGRFIIEPGADKVTWTIVYGKVAP